MSQFGFLQAEFAPVFEHARKAEIAALSDPERPASMRACAWRRRSSGCMRTTAPCKSPYDTALSALIHEPTFSGVVGNALVTKARIIKDHGNRAVHDTKPVAQQTAVTALRELFHFSYWLVRTYAKGAKPAAGLQFSAGRPAEDGADRSDDARALAGARQGL